jgi:bifunctional UDP-N-acetylglucosamine pyrophosphorylase/glucosamine-1-phosphate N-acetyltransferase
VARAFAPHPTVVQTKPLGTGHAAKAALAALDGHDGPVLVVFGDAPLVTTASLRKLVAACRKAGAAVGVLASMPAIPRRTAD